jgi:hypothetical protein
MSSKAERERRHQANLERINLTQRVVGRGDRMRIDHEGTLFERARMLEEEVSAHRATEAGLAAFDRLLKVVEERNVRHARDVALFLEAVWSNKPLPLVAMRGLEQQVGDDMVAVLDAFRYARLNLAQHVEGGARRVARSLREWTAASV